jgi:hypothetical protein
MVLCKLGPMLLLGDRENPGSLAKGAGVAECGEHGVSNERRAVFYSRKCLREVFVDFEGYDLFFSATRAGHDLLLVYYKIILNT